MVIQAGIIISLVAIASGSSESNDTTNVVRRLLTWHLHISPSNACAHAALLSCLPLNQLKRAFFDCRFMQQKTMLYRSEKEETSRGTILYVLAFRGRTAHSQSDGRRV